MPGNFIQFDQMPTAGRNKSTEQQIAELRNYIKGVMDQLRYELRKLGNNETSRRGGTNGDDGSGSKADSFGYPVGSIYMSVRDTNPAFLFGGTWERLQDRFLLAAGETYEAGVTGGEATHTLTAGEMPNHTHTIGQHVHGLNSHTHDLSNHTHGLSNHTHTTDISHGHGFTQPKLRRAQNAQSGTNRYAAQGSDDTVTVNTIGGAVSNYTGSKTSGGPSNNTSGTPSTNTSGAASGNTALSGEFQSGAAGSGTAHNNMPPYLAVYMWQRTA